MEKEIYIANSAAEQNEKKKGLKILIVEDQEYPAIAILNALRANFGNYLLPKFQDISQGGTIQLVDNMEELEQLINSPSFNFDLVILDNRIFEKKILRKKSPNVDLLNEDIREQFIIFADIDDDEEDDDEIEYANAYSAIREIKARGSLVIGTSSMNRDQLKRVSDEEPDFTMSKMFDEAAESLGNLKEVVLKKMEEKKKASRVH